MLSPGFAVRVDEADALPAEDHRILDELLELVEVGGADREGEGIEGLAQLRRAARAADHRDAKLGGQSGRRHARSALGPGKEGKNPVFDDELARIFLGALGVSGVVERDQGDLAAAHPAGAIDLVEVGLRAQRERSAVLADAARKRDGLADRYLGARDALRE